MADDPNHTNEAAGTDPAASDAVAEGSRQAASASDAELLDESGGPFAGDPGGDGVALAELQRERDEYLSLAQRARADFENFRRRAVVQAKEAELRGKTEIAKGLIPVVDNLERALLAAGIVIDPEARAREAAEHPSEEVSAHEALGRGVAMVLGDLQASLARAGVETFDPHGQTFDPATSEALSMRPAAEGESGLVVETLERGYRIGELVIRPARVVVGN